MPPDTGAGTTGAGPPGSEGRKRPFCHRLKLNGRGSCRTRMASEEEPSRRRLRRPPATTVVDGATDGPRNATASGAAPRRSTVGEPGARAAGWTFLTNHAHVLLCVADEPDIRGRDIAARVGITERAAQAIIADLVAGGYIRRRREGRRNRYSVDSHGPMRHPLDHGHTVGELFAALGHLSRPGRCASPRDGDGPQA